MLIDQSVIEALSQLVQSHRDAMDKADTDAKANQEFAEEWLEKTVLPLFVELGNRAPLGDRRMLVGLGQTPPRPLTGAPPPPGASGQPVERSQLNVAVVRGLQSEFDYKLTVLGLPTGISLARERKAGTGLQPVQQIWPQKHGLVLNDNDILRDFLNEYSLFLAEIREKRGMLG